MSYVVSSLASHSRESHPENVSRSRRGKHYTAAIVSNNRGAEDAFRVRYASYLDYGLISQNPERMFRDEFDDLSNTTTIVVYENDTAVGSVRVCFISRNVRDAPAHHAFPREIDAILGAARSDAAFDVVEITRLVRSPACADNQGLVFLLYKLAGYLALSRDVQTVVSSVRNCHIPFYQRLGFRTLAGPMPYPGLNCPMHLLRCGRGRYDQVRAGFPLMDPDAAPSGAYEGFACGRTIAVPIITAN